MNEDIKKILIALMANDIAFHYEPPSCEGRGGYIVNAESLKDIEWEVDEPTDTHTDVRFYPFLHRKDMTFVSNPPLETIVNSIKSRMK